MEYKIQSLASKDAAYLGDRVRAYVHSIAPEEPGVKEEELVLKIENDRGELIAGCIVETGNQSWAQMNLSILWVEESFRRKGLGSMLVCEAERIAREKGCYISSLCTLDFQAKGLYEKHAYTVYAVLEDRPREHTVYYMSKRLDCSTPDYVPEKCGAEGKYEIRRGTDEDAKIIAGGLKRHDDHFAPNLHKNIPLGKKLVDRSGKLVAGIVAGVDGWNGCYIAELYVEEAYRNQGLGSYLLREVEREGKENGAYILLASAGDWNVGFFEREGYTVAGALVDVPRGHHSYELKKRL